MATDASSIDEMLMNGRAPSTPPTSETLEDNVSTDIPDIPYTEQEPEDDSVSETSENHEEARDEVEEVEEKSKDYDEYGNEKPKPRTYTEDEVNERINKAVRERLARGNTESQQPSPQQVADKARDFEYNPESDESWQSQLEQFVEKTVSKMGQKQAQEQQNLRDKQMHSEFETKFSRGMERFNDFRDVVSAQPVTDAMTYALRGMTDPAAFIYAASKRNPAELERISKIPDQYAQMVEMGKLEERMRKVASGTKAPKPVSKSRDDSSLPSKNKKTEPSIEDLIAKSDAKRQAVLNARRRR